LGFLGLRERDLALHNGQIGAFRWICWWHDKQDFIGGGCCVYLKAGGATPGWAVSDLGAPAFDGPEIGIGPSPMAECW